MENIMKIENQKNQIKNLELKNKKLKDTNMDLQTAIIELKCEIKKLEDSRDNLKAFIKRQYEVIQSMTERHNTDIVNAQKTIDEKNKTISGLEHDCKNLKDAKDFLITRIASKEKNIQALTDQFNTRGDVILNLQKVIDEKNETISGLEHDVKNLKNGNDLLRKSIYVRDRKIPDMQKNIESKDKDIQALMDQLDARDREIEKYKFIVIQMADDLYGKGDLDRGEEDE